MPGKSVSGASVALMAAGGVVIWSGLNNTPLLETLRALAKGQAPTPHRNPAFQPLSSASASDASLSSGGGGGGDIVAEARKWIGTKYVYGGCHGCTQCKPGQGVDCSSFVTWVMKAVGCYKGKCSMVAGSTMLAWGTKIPANMVQAGDVVLWVGQHCGIISDPSKKLMIAAPSTGLKVREQTYDFSIAGRTKVYLRAPCAAKSSDTETGMSTSNASSITRSN